MTTRFCDFCATRLDEAVLVDVGLHVYPPAVPTPVTRWWPKNACGLACARSAIEAINYQVLTSRQALEKIEARNLADAKDEVERLRTELARAQDVLAGHLPH